jgi:uncharacterized protein YceH (UPF0502 family)
MPVVLSAIEARVLGALVEKAATTPDTYPLSTNALRLACNQSTNRDPVVDYDDRTVDSVMLELRERGLARTVHQAGSRVSKHRHVLDEALGLTSAELAVLAVLLLRGPQTIAELAARTERYAGGPSGPPGVEAALDGLASGEDPLVVHLERRVGEREPRVMHLLHDSEVQAAAPGPASPAPAVPLRTAPVFTPDRETRRDGNRQEPARPTVAPAPAGRDSGDDRELIEELLRLRGRLDAVERALAAQSARIDELVRELGG